MLLVLYYNYCSQHHYTDYLLSMIIIMTLTISQFIVPLAGVYAGLIV